MRAEGTSYGVPFLMPNETKGEGMYPMDFYGTTVTKTDKGWDVSITYRPTSRAQKATARIEVWIDGDRINYHVADLGRKVRATKAEQERINELYRVAARFMHKELREEA